MSSTTARDVNCDVTNAAREIDATRNAATSASPTRFTSLPASPNLRILLADDHPVITAAIGARLQTQTGWEVCGEVNSATELLHAVDRLAPNVIVTDYHMPGVAALDGARLLLALRRRYPTIAVVVLTMITNPFVLRAILDARVHGLLLKDCPLSEVVVAISRAQRGFTYIGKSALRALAPTDPHTTLPFGRIGTQPLSLREMEVLRLYLTGRTVTEIAATLCRSVKTISRQKNSAMGKLGVGNDRELFECAALQGMVLPRR
ncbi:response regulator transcription factor [Cupriavidus plantarum]|uniref:response regulator transcription factor n=1 Tax=Cupriavidus plantarum TaxID=942865 RepID=UPI000E25BE3B|nr:response regulator transcription factor [Cupriavidus plantarum]NYI01432.1 two-component system capsular synthesis response regulator RcsB [Cupriavidus plantarum]REE90750.1 LuxR family two component transcriptional regulator [Cupriavidus plantarum]RLK33421.1 LuxR family two component transcriptional regulator [Cupriavidus plantarum]CAG2151584.1 Transcriptional regulatory protein RcsB [Cupriavidus plantarum]SMR85137.1 two component transcriptional regulator, LuxR family [Cupriavidus plantarum